MKKTLILLLLAGFSCSLFAQRVETSPSNRAGDPNQSISQSLETTGIVSMSVGVPCLAAGMVCLMYANFVPNPLAGCTTSLDRANADPSLKYLSLTEYEQQAKAFTAKTHAAEVAGYILTPMGGALTIVGVPMYVFGHKMTLNVNYTGNGAGLALNF